MLLYLYMYLIVYDTAFNEDNEFDDQSNRSNLISTSTEPADLDPNGISLFIIHMDNYLTCTLFIFILCSYCKCLFFLVLYICIQ